jgi:SAM-dependent methyltransferase
MTTSRERGAASISELIALGLDREAVVAATQAATSEASHDRPAAPADNPGDTAMSTTLTPQDLDTIKDRQQATWASGDYAVIGTTLQIVGESLCETVDVAAGWRVLDVAAGNGNASLAAARRGCEVTASDYVGALLDGAFRRAEAEGLSITPRLADAEALPFETASFDAVLSSFGVMFVPDPQRAADEMLRVCRPGGRIGLANWTPSGFVGQMFKIVGAHVPPPAGIPSPLAWGTEDRLDELFGAQARVEVVRRHFVFRYRSAEDFFETFKTYYGPVVRAWAALDEPGRESFSSQLIALANEANRATGSLAVPAEYLEVVAHRAG